MPYRDREQQREYQRQWVAERRAEYLSDKSCGFCGSTEDLHLHHFDRGAKVTHRIWSWASERRAAELAKCIVVCRSCHEKRHREERPLFCKRGHELTAANSYVKPSSGRRECRICRALRRNHGLKGVADAA